METKPKTNEEIIDAVFHEKGCGYGYERLKLTYKEGRHQYTVVPFIIDCMDEVRADERQHCIAELEEFKMKRKKITLQGYTRLVEIIVEEAIAKLKEQDVSA